MTDNNIDISKASRGTGPVYDWRITSFVKSVSITEMLEGGDWNPDCRAEYLETYLNWVTSSKVSPVTGLEQFRVQYYVNGVTEAYDIFFLEHKGKRFRTQKGDYPYVRLSVENWIHIEDDELREGDAVILSCPFYCSGGVPENYQNILDQCLELDIPVLVDAAYFGTSFDLSFDFSHPAIQSVAFSLSKFFNVQSFRIGMMLLKHEIASQEEMQVEANYFNKMGASLGLKLMNRFSPNFMVQQHRESYLAACGYLNVNPAHNIMIATIDDDDRRFDKILEDTRFPDNNLPDQVERRICISAYLGYDGTLQEKVVKKIFG